MSFIYPIYCEKCKTKELGKIAFEIEPSEEQLKRSTSGMQCDECAKAVDEQESEQ
jgi:hypothetical protein